MLKLRTILALAAILTTQQVYADDMSDSKSCMTVAKACKAGGYTRGEGSKRFWQDCLKPILAGKQVSGVKVNADTVKSCRADKIVEIQKELNELQEADTK